MSRLPRRLKIVLGLFAAFVLFLVLISPVVLRNNPVAGCGKTLRYAGRIFVAREANAVQSLAIGVGVVSGCGTAPTNVDIRSLIGITPAVAVALPTESGSVYVARGRCPRKTGDALLACLRRQ